MKKTSYVLGCVFLFALCGCLSEPSSSTNPVRTGLQTLSNAPKKRESRCDNDPYKPKVPKVAMKSTLLRSRKQNENPFTEKDKETWLKEHKSRYEQRARLTSKKALNIHPAEQAIRTETSMIASTYAVRLQALRTQYASDLTAYRKKAIELKAQLFQERFLEKLKLSSAQTGQKK